MLVTTMDAHFRSPKAASPFLTIRGWTADVGWTTLAIPVGDTFLFEQRFRVFPVVGLTGNISLRTKAYTCEWPS